LKKYFILKVLQINYPNNKIYVERFEFPQKITLFQNIHLYKHILAILSWVPSPYEF